MDSKFYVSLEAARLLKEKGYDRECVAYYQNDEFHPYSVDRCRLSINDKNAAPSYMNQYSAPTKVEAIDWLESKGIIVDVDYYPNRGKWSADICRESGQAYMNVGKYYLTRLEVEETAIIKACEFL